MLNIDQFQEQYKGTAIDFDGYAGVQCADGVRIYIEECQRLESTWFKPFAGNGKHGDDGVLDGFLSFKNNETSIYTKRSGKDKDGNDYKLEIIDNVKLLQRGDVVFTTGANQWGHTGIFVGNDSNFSNTFQLFDNNGVNERSPAFWWSNYHNNTFVGAIRKVITSAKIEVVVKPEELKTYKVKAGDSLWKIAQTQLGNPVRHNEIYNLNKALIGSNPNLIKIGQILVLP